MISIIICSQNNELLERVSLNIDETIQTPYEIIPINNKTAKLGICEAYNIGAKKAKFEILCFMHEDISIQTYDWGNKLIHHFTNPKYGLIGVAGGDTKSFVPSSWPSYTFPSEISIIQHFKYQKKEAEHVYRTGYALDMSMLKPVACLDGVFLCTKKEVFTKCQFDNKRFPGFHGYDIDYSLQVASAGYKSGVAFDLLVNHFSEGSFNKIWMENAINVSKKWRHFLPYSVRDLPKKEFVHQHWTAMRNFINKLFELQYPVIKIYYYLFIFSFTKNFHLKHFLHFNKEIAKKALTNVLRYSK